MSRFATVGHLISLGRAVSTQRRKRRQAPVDQNAKERPLAQERARRGGLAAANTRGSYLRAQFLRLRARRGPKKAVVAVAASMLTAAYFILQDGTDYQDLGPDYFDRIDRGKTARRLVRKLKELGYEVDVKENAA